MPPHGAKVMESFRSPLHNDRGYLQDFGGEMTAKLLSSAVEKGFLARHAMDCDKFPAYSYQSEYPHTLFQVLLPLLVC